MKLPSTVALEHPTLVALAGHLADRVFPGEPAAAGPPPAAASPATPPRDARGMDDLNERDLAQLLAETLSEIERR